MKINVLIDASGRILATHRRNPTGLVHPSSQSSLTRLRPADGQSLHEVEIPAELEASLANGTFAKRVGGWKLHGAGKTKKLVKSP